MTSTQNDIFNKGSSGDLDAVVDDVVDDVALRRQRGETPELEHYLSRYPQIAKELEDIWPALLMVGCLTPNSATILDHPHAENNAEVSIPMRLGDFQLLKEIGRGGMGIVFAAKQLSLNRTVAVKVLSPHLAKDSKLHARFLREAQSAAKLQHPNIVAVYGNGHEAGTYYYSMQFVAGESLDRIIKRLSVTKDAPEIAAKSTSRIPQFNTTYESSHPDAVEGVRANPLVRHDERSASAGRNSTEKKLSLSTPDETFLLPPAAKTVRTAGWSGEPKPIRGEDYWRNVAGMFQRVAEALDYSHGQQVVHRDIKPSNLLLDSSGEIWITDFGLAKLQTESDLTKTGDILGTLRYISPEQLSGECLPSCDIYGLGATLYEALTLMPAFSGDDKFILLQQINNCEPVSPRSINSAIPKDLETITLRAMAKAPSDRYRSAGEMAADLYRFVQGQPILARPLSRLERLNRWAKRNPVLAGISLLAAVLLIAATIVAGFVNANLRDLANRESDSRLMADKALTAASSARRDSRWKSYVGDMNRGILADALPGGSRLQTEILSYWSSLTEELDFRGWEYYLLASMANKEILRIETNSTSTGVAWHPSDSTILWVENGRFVYYDTDARRIIWQEDFLSWSGACPRFNRTGEWFSLIDSNQSIQVWDLASRSKQFSIDPDDELYSVFWSADGRFIGYLQCPMNTDESTVVICDGKSGQEITRLTNPAGRTAVKCNFSPDSQYLATSYWPQMKPGGQGIAIWNTENWLLEKVIPVPQATITAIVWKPDSSNLAASSLEGKIQIWNFDSNLPMLTSVQARPVFDLEWSRNGEFIAAASENAHASVLLATDLKMVLKPLNHDSSVQSVAFSPDSKKLLTGSSDGKVAIWDTKADPVLHAYQLREQLDSLQPDVLVNWHPNSRLVAAGQAFPTSIFDNQSGDIIRSVLGSYGQWNYDGSLFATKYCDPVSVWDTKGQIVVHERADLGEGLLRDWHPKENKLAGLCNEEEFWIWNVETDQVARYSLICSAGKSHFGCCLEWNPMGTQIAIGTSEGHVLIHDSETGRLMHDWDLGSAAINALAWDPSGTWLAVGSRENQISIVSVQSGKIRLQLEGHVQQVLSLSWSPNGKRIASGSADRQVLVWDADRGESVFSVALSEEVRSVAWSPDGKGLAALTQDGLVRVWNATVGYERFQATQSRD